MSRPAWEAKVKLDRYGADREGLIRQPGPDPQEGAHQAMARTPERRHTVRLIVPSELAAPGLGGHQVRLLDLSFEGARVEHVHPFPDRRLCFLDLPPALGGLSLQGEVVWSQETGRKEVAEGDWVVFFQSGLRFTLLTAGQQAGLTAALDIVKETPKG